MSVPQAIDNNCMSTLVLAEMASTFPKLRHFVQISTVYCNSNQTDGINPEEELHEIAATGTTASLHPSSPGHTAARKTSQNVFSSLATQLFPSSSFAPQASAPAMSQPFPHHGPMNATAVEQCFRLLALSPGTGIIHATEGQTTGTNILDEIPVDWVANLILLHAAAGTRGIVHAGAEAFVPRSFDHHAQRLMDL